VGGRGGGGRTVEHYVWKERDRQSGFMGGEEDLQITF